MALQTITIPDERYDAYRRRPDFIQKHVFPGSCLTSVATMVTSASRTSGMLPVHLEDITPHYAETLRRWRLTFMSRLDEVAEGSLAGVPGEAPLEQLPRAPSLLLRPLPRNRCPGYH